MSLEFKKGRPHHELNKGAALYAAMQFCCTPAHVKNIPFPVEC